ncbi:MacB family efflux pump subunit [Sneathiella sp.]|uniref:MacB family efflux pump subunit n=1 Tax=Sneathiella sp. TaxID=1964365 RepID=UPI002FDF79C0
MDSKPLLALRAVRREYPSGDGVFVALKDINLDIHAGEMVAIIGASGSGKSTLMNILGCLDRPTSGVYRIEGRETARLETDELAELRREHFGFIFQRYHLLGDLSALGNVEMPAIYSGRSRAARKIRAATLLSRLGLADKTENRPGQLSGGQQQRVSIARALMNGGQVILADEPTGALDSASGREVMQILRELHRDGHTVILVTHEPTIAEQADRIIEISDGEIISDRRKEASAPAATLAADRKREGRFFGLFGRLQEAFHMALLAMSAHRLRTFLTMLGIIIGIASVVSVVALGNGSQQQILENISSLGTNTLSIYPGASQGDLRSARVQTLVPADAAALASQSFVDSVTPSVSTSVTTRYRNIAATSEVQGVGEDYFRVRGTRLLQGSFFDAESVESYAQVAVIDHNSAAALFPNGEDPVGAVIIVGSVPMRIIGVVENNLLGYRRSNSLTIFSPYTTVMSRLLGQHYLSSITVRITDDVAMETAEAAVTSFMAMRHGVEDFSVFNTDNIRQTITSTSQTMTLLIAAIALISLIVGGIGVMNIMLVSVTERTSEIGVRMAVGARQGDIMQQFLIETVLVCLLGGAIGIVLALSLGLIFEKMDLGFVMIFSTGSIVAAFVCSTLIGIVFGFLPARNAARLDPVEALARD